MNKLLIIIILITSLSLTGCASEHYDALEDCKDNILDLTCNELLTCDSYCKDEGVVQWSISCHQDFTNQIIAKCAVAK
jgi:hypothetical protein